MLTKAEKTAIMQKYATKEGDTGSPEVWEQRGLWQPACG